MEIPETPRLIVDDCSPEKLANLLARQGGRIAAMSPEGGLFDMIAGRYSANGAPNFDVYLKGHAGDTLRVDRVGRPPEFVANPALTVALAVQPDVTRGLAQKPGFRGRGLLARFAYGLPDSLVGRRAINPPPVPDDVRNAYGAVVAGVLALAPQTEADGSPKPRLLRPSEEAAAAFIAFEAELEPRLGEGDDLGHVAGWAAKLAGAVARWAGVLHVAAQAEAGDDAPWEVPIAGDTMQAAIGIGRDFLVPHALAAFAEMGADPAIEEARTILRWLDGKGEIEEISRRDLHQNLRRRFPKPEQLDPGLRVLVDHGYLREQAKPDREEDEDGRMPKLRGRRPSPVFEVNGLWRTQNSQCTHNGSAASNSVYNVNCVNGSEEADGVPDGCIGPKVCARLGPCERHAAGLPCEGGAS